MGKKRLATFQVRDVLALVLLIGYMVLCMMGELPSETLTALLLMVFAYYGFRRVTHVQ